MAKFTAALSIIILADIGTLAGASNFLHAEPNMPSDLLAKEDVEQALISELYSSSHAAELRSTEEELRPMYLSLPKTAHGKLESSTVRYALHRYFLQKHGWYMRGLDPTGHAWEPSTLRNLTKDDAPAYVQGVLEQHLSGEDMGLHELAVFAATLSHLVHQEALLNLEIVFTGLGIWKDSLIAKKQSDLAIKTFLMVLLSKGSGIPATINPISLERILSSRYPAWEGTREWVGDLRSTYDLMQQDGRNPFVKRLDNFDTTAAFVKELEHRFGSFQNLECSLLKARLVENEIEGSGRVPLSHFYKDGLGGEWLFTESVDYLRSLGALDETDPLRLSVVIPNYVISQTNCLATSGFYSLCCMNQCEDLKRRLEQEIAAPIATPARILDVVSALPSDTVDAPRNLSTALIARLTEISEFHGGAIPVHGRLFSQWMHHTYPRECPFPHLAGTTSSMSQEEWANKYGIDSIDATAEQMEMVAMSQVPAGTKMLDAEAELLPWIPTEELVAEHRSEAKESWLSLREIMVFLALASFATSLVRALCSGTAPSEKTCERHLV